MMPIATGSALTYADPKSAFLSRDENHSNITPIYAKANNEDSDWDRCEVDESCDEFLYGEARDCSPRYKRFTYITTGGLSGAVIFASGGIRLTLTTAQIVLLFSSLAGAALSAASSAGTYLTVAAGAGVQLLLETGKMVEAGTDSVCSSKGISGRKKMIISKLCAIGAQGIIIKLIVADQQNLKKGIIRLAIKGAKNALNYIEDKL